MATTRENIRALVGQQYSIDVQRLAKDSQSLQTSSFKSLATARAVYEQQWAILASSITANLERYPFSDYVKSDDIRDRLVEQNLEDATKLLQACLALRQEYADLAKNFVETKLKSEEFFRLDDIHKQEVKAGLYELPYDEAKDDHEALKAAVDATQGQAAAISTLKTAGALSDAQRQTYSANSGDLAAASTNVDAGTAKDRAGKIATYRSDFDSASWNYSELAVKGNLAQLIGQLATAERKTNYYQKDVAFRSARAAISRELAYTQLAENARSGSVLNYAERMERVAIRFDLVLSKLVPRVLALTVGAHQLYGFKLADLKPTQGNILDDVTDWMQSLQDQIVRYRRRERIFLLSFSIRRNTSAKVSNIKASFGAKFNIATNQTRNQNGLLRGLAFEYVGGSGSSRRPVTIDLSTPASVTANLDGASGNATSLTFGRVLPIPNSLELRPQHTDIIWNGSPYGDWTVSMSPDSFNEADIEDVVLYMWLAFAS